MWLPHSNKQHYSLHIVHHTNPHQLHHVSLHIFCTRSAMYSLQTYPHQLRHVQPTHLSTPVQPCTVYTYPHQLSHVQPIHLSTPAQPCAVYTLSCIHICINLWNASDYNAHSAMHLHNYSNCESLFQVVPFPSHQTMSMYSITLSNVWIDRPVRHKNGWATNTVSLRASHSEKA